MYEDYEFGKTYYRPEPFYFWVYFVGMNAIWFVVPACKYIVGRIMAKELMLGSVFVQQYQGDSESFRDDEQGGGDSRSKQTCKEDAMTEVNEAEHDYNIETRPRALRYLLAIRASTSSHIRSGL